jgi:hypothetical protein
VHSGNNLVYEARLLRLPLGDSVVTLYIVSTEGEWKELASFPIKVSSEKPTAQESSQPSGEGETKAEAKPDAEAAAQADNKNGQAETGDKTEPVARRFGFDKLNLIPSITLAIKSQPAQANFPADARPERATFTDLTMTSSFRAEMARGLFDQQSQFDLVGSSFQKEALRFGDLGEAAPRVDLSSYLMQFKLGKVRYQAGHFSFGASRHLMNNFSSRGIMVTLPLASRADFAVSAMNGTSVVGFGNFFGLAKRRHQLIGGTLGLEFLPKRPGGLRVEAGALSGWLQPVSGFTEGSVNDSERSRGLSIRLIATDPAQRFKLDAGFARSQFTSPSDPLINQGADLAPFPSITRSARYLDASFDLLKDLALGKEKKMSLSLAFRHEQVDPLFRSLGASTQADKVSNEFSMTGAIGEVSAQFAHTRFNDNIRDIPSILKSLTRASTLNVGVPLASLFGNKEKPSPLLPRLSYSINRTGQFGASIPVRGGFELDPGSIPDQVSTNQAITAEWQIEKWRLGYRLNHSFQNNRQPERALADLANLVNGLTVGISPASAIDLNFEVSAESADDKEAATVDRTMRLAPTINWRVSKNMAVASNFSATLAGDRARTKRNRNLEFDVQWSYQFAVERDRFRKLQAQFFVRYANRYARTRNDRFGLSDLQKTQIVNAGLSFNLF